MSAERTVTDLETTALDALATFSNICDTEGYPNTAGGDMTTTSDKRATNALLELGVPAAEIKRLRELSVREGWGDIGALCRYILREYVPATDLDPAPDTPPDA